MSDEAAQPVFSPRTALAVVLAGVFAFAALVVLATYGPELHNGREEGRSHALSRSAVGYAAVVQLARALDLPVSITRRPVRGFYRGLRVLTPDLVANPDVLKTAIAQAGRGRATLIVLPKWVAAPDPLRPGWVFSAGPAPTYVLEGLFPPEDRPEVKRRSGASRPRLTAAGGMEEYDVDVDIGAVDGLQSLGGNRYVPWLRDQDGAVILGESRRVPGLFVLADPDLLNTLGMADRNRAAAALSMLRSMSGGGPVRFDVSINGFAGSPSLIRLALEPPFLAATLAALAAAALMGWAAAVRFGAPRRVPRALAFGKTALAGNTADLLALAKREHRMARPYADLTLQAVAAAVAAPRDLARPEAMAVLDRLAAKAGAEQTPSALADAAVTVRDADGLMRLARGLYDLRRRMILRRT